MIVISPAKRLDNKKADSSLSVTEPIFKNEARELASELSKLNSNQLGELMGVSEAIAELNVERYKNWGKAQSPETRAIFQFEGDVFKNLNARELTADDENYMNDNLRILSGIYGLLKPSDAMYPYRLEMGTRHQFGNDHSLYEFWGAKIADALNADIGDGLLFNLASEEYFSSVKKYIDSDKVINFKFLSNVAGKERVVGVVAKRARGAMARFLITNRVKDTESISNFSELGFKFKDLEKNCFTFIGS